MKALGEFVFLLLPSFYAALVLQYGWNEYVTPLGVAALQYPHALGLHLFFGYVCGLSTTHTSMRTRALAEKLSVEESPRVYACINLLSYAIMHLLLWLVSFFQ